MTKAQFIALSIVPIFFLNHSNLRASEPESLELIKTQVDACLPVRPLPFILSLDDAKLLYKANYGPRWCQLVNHLGYQWAPSPKIELQPPEKTTKEGRRIAERAANDCLQTSVNLSFSLRNRIISYVSHQYQCEKKGDTEACQRANKLALNILYGNLSEKEIRKMKVRLKRIQEKSKACPKREEVTQYCQNIGMRTIVCDRL